MLTFGNKAILAPLLLLLVTAAFGQDNLQTEATDGKNIPPAAPLREETLPFSDARTGKAADATTPLTRDEAVQLALKQASAFQQSQINEQIAAQDIKQAKTALYPRLNANPAVIYNTPSLGNVNPSTNTPRPPSFLGANAISEYQSLVTLSGELDVSGRLRAVVRRNQALLEAARLGTEIERRNLVFAVNDAYFNLEIATARRRAAEENLRAAEAFEHNVKLNLDAGEVAPVELTRARLQTTTRRDELIQNQSTESTAADSLRILVGYQFTQPIAATDLLTEVPQAGEIESYAQTALQTRPEFAQFEAQRLAAELEIKAERATRRPNIVYSLENGFISDSLVPKSIKDSLGVRATVGISIPIFDAGASRSREAQARLRLQSAQNQRTLTERQFAAAFFTAREVALSAITRIKLAASAIDDARSNLSASLARYQAGEALITEVTDAQNTLIVQQTSLYQALFDYQTARARLLQALGK